MRNPRTGVTKMVNWKEFVEVNPKIMQGKPVIKGTRIPVSLVLSYLAGGMTVDEILAEYILTSVEKPSSPVSLSLTMSLS